MARILIFVVMVQNTFAQTPANWVINGFPNNNQLSFSPSFQASILNNVANAILLTNAEIADQSGNILFYSNGFTIWNSNNQKVLNADTLGPCYYTTLTYNNGSDIWQEAVFIPDPGDSNEFYLFHGAGDYSYQPPGFASSYIPTKLYYSKINKSINGPTGIVTSKNNVVLNDTLGMSICAIKHGNGRDCWILVRHCFKPVFYRLLVTPYGIIGPFSQVIGSINYLGFTNFKFASLTNKAACYNGYHQTSLHHCDIYDFDRCTGLMSNPVTLTLNDSNFWPWPGGCEFSPNGKFLYVSTMMKLRQYDVTAANIAASAILLDTVDLGTLTHYPTGVMQLGPDNKIYLCNNISSSQFLHVINYPDSAGTACGFVNKGILLPNYHFNDLPNIPDYNLVALAGSACDTLTAMYENTLKPTALIYPNPATNILMLQLQNVGYIKEISVEVYDASGKRVLHRRLNSFGEKKIDIAKLPEGLYAVRVMWDYFAVTQKFVKN